MTRHVVDNWLPDCLPGKNAGLSLESKKRLPGEEDPASVFDCSAIGSQRDCSSGAGRRMPLNRKLDYFTD